jgi:hypothetical protein
MRTLAIEAVWLILLKEIEELKVVTDTWLP